MQGVVNYSPVCGLLLERGPGALNLDIRGGT